MSYEGLADASPRKPDHNTKARPGPVKLVRGETDGASCPKDKGPQIDPKKASYGYLLKAMLQAWRDVANFYLTEADEEEKNQKELWCQHTAAFVRNDPSMLMDFAPLLDDDFDSHYALSHLLKTLGDDAVTAVPLLINGLIEQRPWALPFLVLLGKQCPSQVLAALQKLCKNHPSLSPTVGLVLACIGGFGKFDDEDANMNEIVDAELKMNLRRQIPGFWDGRQVYWSLWIQIGSLDGKGAEVTKNVSGWPENDTGICMAKLIAISLLSGSGSAVAKSFQELIAAAEPQMQIALINVLYYLTGVSDNLCGELCKMLKSHQPEAICAAANALSSLRRNSGDAIVALLAAKKAHSSKPDIRRAVQMALHQLDSNLFPKPPKPREEKVEKKEVETVKQMAVE
ncbi:MAG: hypothetical protein WCJ35_13525 [Planctomycetota bacterium]